MEITFEDRVKSVGNFYRSISQSKETTNGRRYPEPRPTVVFFHGFWNKKEVNENYLIPLAHMGYVTVAFDQRGHGEAAGKKADWFKMFNDVKVILDKICSFKDVREGSLCCVGKSMGGTSVLTRCYEDRRVSMVVAMSALHDPNLLIEAKFRFLSAGWFVKHEISKIKNKQALKICARNFLKKDADFNKNRVFLIHAKQDKIFPPSITFKLNKAQSRISESHAILLDNCGHSLDGQEALVSGIILKWILENEAMKLKEIT